MLKNTCTCSPNLQAIIAVPINASTYLNNANTAREKQTVESINNVNADTSRKITTGQAKKMMATSTTTREPQGKTLNERNDDLQQENTMLKAMALESRASAEAATARYQVLEKHHTELKRQCNLIQEKTTVNEPRTAASQGVDQHHAMTTQSPDHAPHTGRTNTALQPVAKKWTAEHESKPEERLIVDQEVDLAAGNALQILQALCVTQFKHEALKNGGKVDENRIRITRAGRVKVTQQRSNIASFEGVKTRWLSSTLAITATTS